MKSISHLNKIRLKTRNNEFQNYLTSIIIGDPWIQIFPSILIGAINIEYENIELENGEIEKQSGKLKANLST